MAKAIDSGAEDPTKVKRILRRKRAKRKASVSNNLEALRKAAGLSQDELAALAGVAQGSVCRIEYGRTPGIDTAQLLADALGAKLGDVFPPKGSARS